MSAAPLVLPVGFRLGAETLPRPVPGSVRLGWRRLGLDADEARVWDLAHGAVEDTDHGRDLLVERAAGLGVASPADVVAGLLARSLLVELPTGGPDLAAAAGRLRARPLLLGLGSGRDGTTGLLGLPGWPVLELPRSSVRRWEDTAASPDLVAAAELAVLREWDRVHPDADAESAPVPTADEVAGALADVVADLPALLARSCGYLDLADPAA
ncbi:hypothetical protein [Klenkia terrae]|uniref:Alpha/beta hydrolase n=1 Tax=Klenkia terrae TaxID=1052259 RepID=A0ABU8E7G6_9ACTN|nr:hypothetical protein [Klenkia terrae]